MLHDIFQVWVKKTPGACAFQFENEEALSYQALADYSDKFADYLLKHGVQPGDEVGVYFPRSVWFVLSMLALSKIGATYVPIKSNGKGVDELKTENAIIKNCKIKHLLCHRTFREKALRFFQTEKMYLFDELSALQQYDKPKIDRKKITGHYAYIVYSSGTSGDPKGIPHYHNGFHYWSDVMAKELPADQVKHVLDQVSEGFDAHHWQYIRAWTFGAMIHMVSEITQRNSQAVKDYMCEHKITDATLSPPFFLQIMEDNHSLKQLKESGCLRIDFTGANLKPEIVIALNKEGIKPINCYGSTEEFYGHSMYICGVNDINKDIGLVRIGNALTSKTKEFIRCYDSDGKTTEIVALESVKNASGELLIQSEFMTPGYYGNEKKTKESFKTIKCDTDGKKYEHVFYTGDEIALRDGKSYVAGRCGDRFKLNDIDWVNKNEIAKVLEDIFHCLEVAVFPIEPFGNQLLVAIVNSKFDENEKECLQSKMLSRGMKLLDVPSEIFKLAELGLSKMPLTANKKLDVLTLKAEVVKKITQRVMKDDKVESILPELSQTINISELSKIKKTITSIAKRLIAEIRPALINEEANKINFMEIGLSSIEGVRFNARFSKVFRQKIAIDFTKESPEEKNLEDIILKLFRPYVFRCGFKYIENGVYKYPEGAPTLFCFPPVDGGATEYTEFVYPITKTCTFSSPLLNPHFQDQPEIQKIIYAALKNVSFEEIGRCLVLNIRCLQAVGPYYLAGFSLGGNLAFLVYNLLKNKEKQAVNVIGLIDPPAPGSLASMPSSEHAEKLRVIADEILSRLKSKQAYKFLPDKELFNFTDTIFDKRTNSQQINIFFETIIANIDALLKSGSEYAHLINHVRNIFITIKLFLSAFHDWVPDSVVVDNAILFIARQGVRGQPECNLEAWKPYLSNKRKVIELDCDHFEIIRSPELKVAFEKHLNPEIPYSENFISALQAYYREHSKMRLQVFDSPMHIDDCYINLGLVTNKDQQKREYELLVDLNGTGRSYSYEDIFEVSHDVELSALFDRNKDESTGTSVHSSRHIITGRAGIGKSTLCQYIYYAWADKGLWSRFDAVFWLPLRNLQQYSLKKNNSYTSRDLAEFICFSLHSDPLDSRFMKSLDVNTIQRILDDPACRILFLYDGYDEVAVLEDKTEYEIFIRMLFSQESYIVTSRPHPINDVSIGSKLREIPARYELLGFKNEDIINFVKKIFHHRFPENDDLQVKQFITMLQSNPSLWGLAHVPINLELMANFLNPMDFNSAQVKSVTEIYERVIVGLKKRYLRQHWGIRRYHERDIQRDFNIVDICLEELAFVAFSSNKIYFTDEDLNNILDSHEGSLKWHLSAILKKRQHDVDLDLDNSETLLIPLLQSGLLNSVKSGDVQLYYFIHYTFQEFYAANYLKKWISEGESSKRNQNGLEEFSDAYAFIRTIMYDSRYENLMRLLAGLLRNDEESLEILFKNFQSYQFGIGIDEQTAKLLPITNIYMKQTLAVNDIASISPSIYNADTKNGVDFYYDRLAIEFFIKNQREIILLDLVSIYNESILSNMVNANASVVLNELIALKLLIQSEDQASLSLAHNDVISHAFSCARYLSHWILGDSPGITGYKDALDFLNQHKNKPMRSYIIIFLHAIMSENNLNLFLLQIYCLEECKLSKLSYKNKLMEEYVNVVCNALINWSASKHYTSLYRRLLSSISECPRLCEQSKVISKIRELHEKTGAHDFNALMIDCAIRNEEPLAYIGKMINDTNISISVRTSGLHYYSSLIKSSKSIDDSVIHDLRELITNQIDDENEISLRLFALKLFFKYTEKKLAPNLIEMVISMLETSNSKNFILENVMYQALENLDVPTNEQIKRIIYANSDQVNQDDKPCIKLLALYIEKDRQTLNALSALLVQDFTGNLLIKRRILSVLDHVVHLIQNDFDLHKKILNVFKGTRVGIHIEVAAYILGSLNYTSQEIRATLFETLDFHDLPARESAAKALGLSIAKDLSVINLLKDSLKSPNPLIRKASILAFTEIDEPSVKSYCRKTFLTNLETEDTSVKEAIIFYFKRYHENDDTVIKALSILLNDKSDWIRKIVSTTLWNLGYREKELCYVVIQQCLSETNRHTWLLDAVVILSKIGSPDDRQIHKVLLLIYSNDNYITIHDDIDQLLSGNESLCDNFINYLHTKYKKYGDENEMFIDALMNLVSQLCCNKDKYSHIIETLSLYIKSKLNTLKPIELNLKINPLCDVIAKLGLYDKKIIKKLLEVLKNAIDSVRLTESLDKKVESNIFSKKNRALYNRTVMESIIDVFSYYEDPSSDVIDILKHCVEKNVCSDRAIKTLGKIAGNNEAVEAIIIKSLRHNDKNVRISAVEALCVLAKSHTDLYAHLGVSLKDIEKEIRLISLNEIHEVVRLEFRKEVIFESILECQLDDVDPEVSAEASKLLTGASDSWPGSEIIKTSLLKYFDSLLRKYFKPDIVRSHFVPHSLFAPPARDLADSSAPGSDGRDDDFVIVAKQSNNLQI